MNALATAEGLLGALVLFVGAAAAAWFVTRWVTRALERRAILDRPNERSAHSAPVPRGGGIGVLVVVVPLAAVIFALHQPGNTMATAVLAVTVGLAALSWLDDLRGIPAPARLAGHVIGVAIALAFLPDKLLVFEGALPLAADRIVTALGWVWFVNLFNFMDGIDGLAGVETISLGVGLFIILLILAPVTGASGIAMAQIAVVMAGAGAGFLVLNWPPARVFMGDVGTIALGFLIGWFLVLLAAWGFLAAALILPAYYLGDATLTLARRAIRGEAVWRAHNQHFYQRAAQRGFGHGRICRMVAATNVILIFLAVMSTQTFTWAGDALCLAGAIVVVAVALHWMARATPDRAAP